MLSAQPSTLTTHRRGVLGSCKPWILRNKFVAMVGMAKCANQPCGESAAQRDTRPGMRIGDAAGPLGVAADQRQKALGNGAE
ncbi:hypothetical protein [Methylobacterium trifolii]|uniref:Uncharacterized protein n=1 Tax=Methylobacterium trifolii TaxID=1003092 RepID=A0ABQ4U3Y6_9HYPH|nr:hypothetical protein [Methylobacterium trifolii]GJE62161.1 hypothetical protein MPOCJGCO_4291 [Methylobacterium trifolii]